MTSIVRPFVFVLCSQRDANVPMLTDKSNSNSGFMSSNCNSDSNSTDLPPNGLRATRNAKREAVNQMSLNDSDSSDSEADNARKNWPAFSKAQSSGSDEENNNASTGEFRALLLCFEKFSSILNSCAVSFPALW